MQKRYAATRSTTQDMSQHGNIISGLDSITTCARFVVQYHRINIKSCCVLSVKVGQCIGDGCYMIDRLSSQILWFNFDRVRCESSYAELNIMLILS